MTSLAGIEPPPRRSAGRRLSAWLYRRPGARLGALIAGPFAWIVILYLGSLAVLLVSAFWQLNPLTQEVVHEPTLKNFQTIVDVPCLPDDRDPDDHDGRGGDDRLRPARVPDRVLHGAHRLEAARRLLLVAILIPLWASYLVKVYSWRIILGKEGVLNWLLEPFGLTGPGYSITGTWLVFTYLWLPYMILPLYAGLERIPGSLLEASADSAPSRAARSSGSCCRSSSRRWWPARSSPSR